MSDHYGSATVAPRSARFLFPGDARHSRSHVNHERWGDQRTRQYKGRVDKNTGEVRGGNMRAIRGQELWNCRRREDKCHAQRGTNGDAR